MSVIMWNGQKIAKIIHNAAKNFDWRIVIVNLIVIKYVKLIRYGYILNMIPLDTEQNKKKLFETIPQSNFFAALCIIFAIFRPFCDNIADMQLIAAYYTQLCSIICQVNDGQLSPQKRSFTTIKRRICGDISPGITQCCIMLYNFVT